MLMSREAMVHCFLHAAALASSLGLDSRAAPGKVSASKASRSMTPRSTRRSPMVRGPPHLALLVLDELPIMCASRSHEV
eukprot:2361363-Pyramimonas_sp.AAC.1